MPYQLTWKYPSRVIHQRIFGQLSLDEFRDVATKLDEMVDEGTPLVHVISDLVEIEKFPTNLNAIRKQLPEMGNDKIGWVLLVTRHQVINHIAYVICQIVIRNVRFRVFDTVDAAFAFLLDIDATIQAAPTVKQIDT